MLSIGEKARKKGLFYHKDIEDRNILSESIPSIFLSVYQSLRSRDGGEYSPPTDLARARFRTRGHVWVKLIVSYLLWSERFFFRFFCFPLPSKVNISNSNSIGCKTSVKTTFEWVELPVQMLILLIIIIIITPAETWKLPLIKRKGFQIPMDSRAYALASHKPCDVQTAFMMECTAVA